MFSGSHRECFVPIIQALLWRRERASNHSVLGPPLSLYRTAAHGPAPRHRDPRRPDLSWLGAQVGLSFHCASLSGSWMAGGATGGGLRGPWYPTNRAPPLCGCGEKKSIGGVPLVEGGDKVSTDYVGRTPAPLRDPPVFTGSQENGNGTGGLR